MTAYHRFSTRVNIELGEDVRDMGIDGAAADEEGVGDLPIGPLRRDLPQDRQLARR